MMRAHGQESWLHRQSEVASAAVEGRSDFVGFPRTWPAPHICLVMLCPQCAAPSSVLLAHSFAVYCWVGARRSSHVNQGESTLDADQARVQSIHSLVAVNCGWRWAVF
ncbi:hypothetical protein L1887_47765 [Cichorium endivia]|nr:hypothetical protein L1887_47765 [Cichorium endivia]